MKKFRLLWLIATSLILLGAFEAVWLRKTWQEQEEGLRQQVDYLFQQTVTALQDSLVRRSLAKDNLPFDTSRPAMPFTFNVKAAEDSVNTTTGVKMEAKSSMIVRIGDRLDSADTVALNDVRVFVAIADSQSLPHQEGMDRLFLDLPKRVKKISGGRQFFSIVKDTFSLAELQENYRNKLRDASLPQTFAIVQTDTLPASPPEAGISTQAGVGGLLTGRFYQAQFSDYRVYLLRKALPFLAFALLLFGVTAVAFVVVYHSLQQQQRLARLKNEFISNITHELKTPITTVGVALEALSDFDAGRSPEKTREYLEHSKLELRRLSLLVEKVLRLSMFEEQEPHLTLRALDFSAVVRQVLAAMQLQAERSGAEIRFEAAEGQDFTVRGDALHLSSVVFNLVDNALKYTNGCPLIRVSLEKQAGSIRLSVQDNGIGIPADYQTRIFDKFFRVPSGDRHDVKGHGLGLSYAAQVVRQHGGRLQVSSVEGQGSTFTVDIPVPAHSGEPPA